MTKILVTGVAGFIGFHVCQRLLNENRQVVGLDNLNDYYEISLKKDRLRQLKLFHQFEFYYLDIENQEAVSQLFIRYNFDIVIHLAAQAGVRYSLQNPHAYINSNITGFLNILEGCRHTSIKHLIFASSSSVYGANRKIPFSVNDTVDAPVSLYAATKKANELMAHTYSHIYNIPITGLRFFTVYGPWGRPDMAYFSFTKAITEKQPIKIFNQGKMQRDFTYIDDIVEGIIKLIYKSSVPVNSTQTSSTPRYKIYNIGNNKPIKLLDFVEALEKCIGVKAEREFLPMQPGDVEVTYADIDDLIQDVGFKPNTSIEVGLRNFVDWYREYYKV